MKVSQRRMPRRIALGVVLVLLSAFIAATAATAQASTADPTEVVASSTLSASQTVAVAPSRTASLAASRPIVLPDGSYRRKAPAHRAHRAPRASTARTASGGTPRTASSRTHTTVAPKPRKPVTVSRSSSGELAQARAILASYIAKYPICKGATVYITMVPALQGGADGCVFLGSGTIVINPHHQSSLAHIIDHEIGHLIDYRQRH